MADTNCADQLVNGGYMGVALRQKLSDLLACENEELYPSTIADVASLCRTGGDFLALVKEASTFSLQPVKKTVDTIAQYYYRIGNGGVERAMAELAFLFDSMGKRTVVITNEEAGPGTYPLPERAIRKTLPLINADHHERSILVSHLRRLAQLIRENDVDTCIFHAWLNEHTIWDVLLCKKLGVRCILVAHGTFSFSLTLPTATRNLFSYLPYMVSLYDAVVALNDASHYYFSRFNSNTFTIPNPLPSELESLIEVKARSFNVDEMPQHDAPTVLWVGRFDELKRPLDAIRIMKQVVKETPDARLVMVGKSEDGHYEPLIEQEIGKLGLADTVVMTGFTSNVIPFYQNADVFLFTTEIEGYPMVLLEAASSGLPVAMYDLPYLATADCTDWIVTAPVGDITQSASNIIRILNNPDVLNKMSNAASAYAQSLLSYDWASAWESVFAAGKRERNVLEQNGAESAFWNALLDHCLRGNEAALTKCADKALETEMAVRRHYESSNSWRIGRAVTAVPRRLFHKDA